MSEPKTITSLGELLRQAIGDQLASDADTFLDMCAGDIVFEFPYSPPEGVSKLRGKEELAAYLPRVGDLLEITDLKLEAVHRSTDPGVIVIEFSADGRGVHTGAPYDQRYISVIHLRNGRIVRYRDYWNPLVLLQTAGGAEALREALVGA